MTFAAPLRDPTPPRLRADELAASLLREADAELRGEAEADDGAAAMHVDSLPRLPPGGNSSPSRAKADAPATEAPSGKSKGKAKGKAKGKSKNKGKDKGKAGKGGRKGAVIPPPGNF